MTSRQVQWRRFPFFDKDTISGDITMELGGAEVSCMHTAGGRLYLGEFQKPKRLLLHCSVLCVTG